MRARLYVMPDPSAAARDRLIEGTMPLVRHIARAVGKRVPPCFDISDLEGPGYLGLVKASKRFHMTPDKGDHRPIEKRFKDYVRRAIEGHILDAVRRSNWREANHQHIEDYTENSLSDQKEIALFLVDKRPLADELAEVALKKARTHSAVKKLEPRKRKIIQFQLRKDATITESARHSKVSQSQGSKLTNQARAELRVLIAA